MSGNNPYAVNGYGANQPGQNSSNPYGRNPYANQAPAGYGDPYLQQNNNASSASVNSYGSRDNRRREEQAQSRDAANPYARQPPRRRSPPPQPPAASNGNPYEQAARPRAPSSDIRANTPGAPPPERRAGSGGGGYGGLGAPPSDPYGQPVPTPTRPMTSGRQESRDSGREREQDRSRAYSDSRSRERRAPPQPDPSSMPPPVRSQQPQQQPQQPPNGNHTLSPPATNGAYNANRQYSPRRPAKSLDEILKTIQSQWSFMEGDECVPVKVALQLADPSSLGLGDREADFADTHIDLQKSLKSVVNEHYADFNSAVGTYHKIQASIRESQNRVRYLKTGLMTVKGGMLTTRPELRNLAEQSGQLDDLLVTIGQIEALREMPAKLEEKINEKKWIGAVEVLGDALVACRKSGLDDIGAMADLRSYFTSQEGSLVDMLIEELHDHLYLKSPYCVDRWKGRKMGQDTQVNEVGGGNAWDRPVYRFLGALDTKKPLIEDASKNPETDTFYYVHVILEALNKRGYLEETIARIEQRLPVELYKVVERTNNEIDAKYPTHLRGRTDASKRDVLMLQSDNQRSQVLSDFLYTLYAKFEAIAEGHRVLHEIVLGVAARENLSKPEKYGTSFKELWKLYQMEIRSLLHDYLATDSDMVSSAGKNMANVGDVFSRQPRDKAKRMFKLGEMDQKSAAIKTEEAELDEILKSSVPGLVSKTKSAQSINAIADRRDHDGIAAGHKLLIEASVFNMTILLPPSLAFLQHLKEIVPQTSHIPMSTLTSFLDDFLINVFHPQLDEAVTELCTQNMLDFEAFMEDPRWARLSPHPIFKGAVGFMHLIKAFSAMLSAIPQDQMFTQLVVAQLFKYYDRCYRFYKSLVSRSANSASTSNAQVLKAAAGMAEGGEVHNIANELWSAKSLDNAARADLNKKEVQLLIAASKSSPLQPYDLISDPKSVHQLSLVYNSMQWLSSSINQLRHVDAGTSSKTHTRKSSLTANNPRRWTLITALKQGHDSPNTTLTTSEEPVYLPLTSETVVPFDETIQSFRALATKALLTLHIDIRLGIIHQLHCALRPPELEAALNPDQDTSTPTKSSTPTTGPSRDSAATTTTGPPLSSGLYPHLLPAPPTSASARILELNNELISFDANIASYIGSRERKFILTGLARLVDRYLVVGADYIGVMNAAGAEGIRVDALVVQQVLRSLGVSDRSAVNPSALTPDALAPNGLGISTSITTSSNANRDANTDSIDDDEGLLTSSSTYYGLFLTGPASILEFIKTKKPTPEGVPYTYDELRTLVELCYSAAVRGEDREEGLKARKGMGDVLLALGEGMWDS